MTQPDPLITVSIWRGPQSALAARLGIAPAILAPLVKRRGQRRGANGWEVQIESPQALRTLRHMLTIADEAD